MSDKLARRRKESKQAWKLKKVTPPPARSRCERGRTRPRLTLSLPRASQTHGRQSPGPQGRHPDAGSRCPAHKLLERHVPPKRLNVRFAQNLPKENPTCKDRLLTEGVGLAGKGSEQRFIIQTDLVRNEQMKHVTAVAAWGAAAAGSRQTAAAAGGSVTGAGLRARPRLRERCRSRCRSRSRAWHARWHVRDALLREQTGRGSEGARAPAGSWQMLLASAARAWPRSLGPCCGTTVWGGAQRGGFKEEKTEREAARPGGWRAPPWAGPRASRRGV